MRREFGEEVVQAKMYVVIFPKTDDKVRKNWGKDIFLFPRGVRQRPMAECSLRDAVAFGPWNFGGILGVPW